MTMLDGARVLLVEDELLVAMTLEDILRREGCLILGPFRRVEKAALAARTEAIDIALLDVNLAGERVFPVAAALVQRRLPFVFMTGYGPGDIAPEYAGRPVIGKPFRTAELVEALTDAFHLQRAG